MPVPICPRKDSEQGLILQGIKCQSAPASHVRRIRSRFGILVNLPSHKGYSEDAEGIKRNMTAQKHILKKEFKKFIDQLQTRFKKFVECYRDYLEEK